MHTPILIRHSLLTLLCCATPLFADPQATSSASGSVSAMSVRSPLDEASAIQRQLNRVVDHSSGSVFAVTAFFSETSEPALYQKSIPASTFVQIAERAQRSCGTAFAIDGDGYLLTNEHVVSGAKSVWITTDQGNTFPALVIGTDPRGDLAVLKIPAQTKPISLGEKPNAAVARGDLVVTIGNPGGMSITGEMAASVGNVSAVGRALPKLSAREHRFYGDLLQVTTPIATGSSGGPLLDLSGNAIGVICAVVPNSTSEQNIGFAINLSPAVRSRVESLKQGKESVYGYLGVNVSPADADGAGTVLAGARVDRVDAGTPAFGILEVGDVVLKFDEKPIGSDIDFIRYAGACDIDRDVPVTIVREAQTLDLKIRPRRRMMAVDPINTSNQQLTWSGVTFENHDGGAIVTAIANENSTPLKKGQVVNSVNGEPIGNLTDLLTALHRHAGDSLEIDLLSHDESDVSR